MLKSYTAHKCVGKDKGKNLLVYVQEPFVLATQDDEQITFSCNGLTKMAYKVILIVSFSQKEWESVGKDQEKLNWAQAKYYAYDR